MCVVVAGKVVVNNSEYSKSTGAKPILSRGGIYLVSPGALRAPTSPRPLHLGGGKYQKKKIASSVDGRRLDKFSSALAWWGWRLLKVQSVRMGHRVARCSAT
jgi:hypothetical protein